MLYSLKFNMTRIVLPLVFVMLLFVEFFLGFTLIFHPLIPVALVFIFAAVVTALINPGLGITVLIFTVPFAHGKFNILVTDFYEMSVINVMVFCIAFLYLIEISYKQKLVSQRSPIDSSIILFLCWAVFTLFWSPSLFVGGVHLFLIITVVLLYFVLDYAIQDMQTFEYAVLGWWVTGVFFSLLGFAQYLGVVKMETEFLTGLLEGYSRVVGLSGSPSTFAGTMLLVFFTMLGAYHLYDNREKKLLVGICLIFSLLTIILTLSRSAFIGLSAGIMLYTFRYIFRIKNLLFFILISIIFFTFGMLTGIEFGDRLTSILNFYKEGAWIIRLSVWYACIDMFLSNYGLGTGLGGIEVLFKEYFVKLVPVTNVPPHPHSLYMDVLTHFGVIGMSIFIFLFVRLAIYLYKLLKELGDSKYGKMLWSLTCGLTALGVQVVIVDHLHIAKLWAYLGTIVAFSRVAADEYRLLSNETGKG